MKGHIHYKYRAARREWGEPIANLIWDRLPRRRTQARLTADERAYLSDSRSTADPLLVRIVDAVVVRSISGD